jgi:hypothetical protein
MQGMPPPEGWALRYVSGIGDPEVKPRYWLSQCHLSSAGQAALISFDPAINLCFGKQVATKISDALRAGSGIETEVVEIVSGVPLS